MKRILLIDDDRDTVDRLAAFVGEGGKAFQLQSAVDADTALHRVRAWKPHVLLLGLRGEAAPALIKRIRAAPPDDYSAILVLHADLSNRLVRTALEAGADDALALPFDEVSLALRLGVLARLKELHDSVRRANHRLDEMSNTDDLTGIMNLRALYRRAEEEIARAGRFHKPVTAIMLNINAFATANRDHGFVFGDLVLQEAAKRIKACLRSIDFAGRVGGDEFFAFLTETDLSEAEFVAERVRQAFHAEPFRSDKTSCSLTASIGVGGFVSSNAGPDRNRNMSNLLHITSEALRAAAPDHIEIYSFG